MLGTSTSFEDAVAEAVRMEMHRDSAVVLYAGSDTEGVTAQIRGVFDADRTFATRATGAPIVLAAAGAAAEGLRPVCEIGEAEAGAATLDQIAEIGAMHFANGRTPAALCVRLACGDPLADNGAASVDPLGWLIGAPGIKVVCPATPSDAKGLTVAAIRDPEPVCVVEDAHARRLDEIVPEGAHIVEIGRARMVREGGALSVIAHGAAVEPAEHAIAEAGIDADLLDLRSLQPLDTAAVLTSVRKSGRVVVVEPDASAHRVTAELVSAIWEEVFEYLDAPPRRVRMRRGRHRLSGGGANGPGASAIDEITQVCVECLAY